MMEYRGFRSLIRGVSLAALVCSVSAAAPEDQIEINQIHYVGVHLLDTGCLMKAVDVGNNNDFLAIARPGIIALTDAFIDSILPAGNLGVNFLDLGVKVGDGSPLQDRTRHTFKAGLRSVIEAAGSNVPIPGGKSIHALSQARDSIVWKIYAESLAWVDAFCSDPHGDPLTDGSIFLSGWNLVGGMVNGDPANRTRGAFKEALVNCISKY